MGAAVESPSWERCLEKVHGMIVGVAGFAHNAAGKCRLLCAHCCATRTQCLRGETSGSTPSRLGKARQLEGFGPLSGKELAKGASQARPTRKQKVPAGSKADP